MGDNHKEELTSITIHSSLNTPNLLFGADRELILVVGLISAVLIFLGLTLETTIIGIVVWLVFSLSLRMMAKIDPLMRKIYIKQLKYKKYYEARSTPFYKDN